MIEYMSLVLGALQELQVRIALALHKVAKIGGATFFVFHFFGSYHFLKECFNFVLLTNTEVLQAWQMLHL